MSVKFENIVTLSGKHNSDRTFIWMFVDNSCFIDLHGFKKRHISHIILKNKLFGEIYLDFTQTMSYENDPNYDIFLS